MAVCYCFNWSKTLLSDGNLGPSRTRFSSFISRGKGSGLLLRHCFGYVSRLPQDDSNPVLPRLISVLGRTE